MRNISNSRHPRSRLALAALLALFLIAGVAIEAGIGAQGAASSPKPSATKKPKRPNILVVMSDDQTAEEQKVMDIVNRRIGAQGATFRDSFASNPLCCPSRATFLTGQYSRNNGVLDNSKPNGSYAALDHSNTLPVWLQDSGYYTSLIGKYLNGYEKTLQPQTIPPGWTNWQATTQTYIYYGYRFNINGRSVEGGEAPSDYLTDVETQKAVDLIRDRAGTRKPWFTWLTYLAPHSGGPSPVGPNPPQTACESTAKPAPRDVGAFSDAVLPKGPSFNEADVSDKPSFISDQADFNADDVDKIERNYRCRRASLLAVDRGVDRVMDTLKATGQLDNTYVIYTSDNGWFDGQHRIANGKRRLYEPSIRVPLLIRGPGIEPGTKVKDLVVNADLAPTIVKLAEAEKKVRRVMDGRPLQPFMKNPDVQRGREILLNGTRKKGVGLRTRRYSFAKFQTQEYEMYDLRTDPEELQNVYGDPVYAQPQAALEQDLENLRVCTGKRCQRSTGAELHVQRRAGPGRQCRRLPVAATATVPGGGIDQVTFRINSGPSTLDPDPPFQVAIPERASSGAKVRVDARVELIDGRLVTLRNEVPVCR